MNSSLILEMVAARAAATENTAVADLVTRLHARSGDLSDPASQDLIAQVGRNNPMLGALVRQMAESRPTKPTRETIVIDQEVSVPEASPPDVSTECDDNVTMDAVNELREHARSMFEELQILRRRSDELAAALGACCMCWGDDANCRNCRGRGTPGFSLPHEVQFQELVLPAIQALKAQRSAWEARVRRMNEETKT